MLEERDVYCGKTEALKQGSHKLLSRGEDTQNVSWELGYGQMIEDILGIKKACIKARRQEKSMTYLRLVSRSVCWGKEECGCGDGTKSLFTGSWSLPSIQELTEIKGRINGIGYVFQETRFENGVDTIKNLWYTYTMELYAAERKKELIPFAMAWMELESIMLSEISQVVRDKYHMISPLTGT